MTRNRRRPARRPEIDALHSNAGNAADLLKMLANEQRLRVLCLLIEGELSVGQINERVALSQSALSQHLAKLRAQKLVTTRRDAQTIYYSLPGGPAKRLIGVLHDIYCAIDPGSRGGPRRKS